MHAIAVPSRITIAGIRITSEAIFISKASIFLPRYSGVRPDHQAADEDRHDREGEHAVEPGADAAEHDLAELRSATAARARRAA